MRRGFTLIELLVVIAIIAILAAILFPVFARAREKARQSSCLANVKQILLGIQMYVQDYDERFPIYDYGSSASLRLYWDHQIQPYLKNTNILKCPSRLQNTSAIHYGYNYDSITDGYNGASLSRVEYPSTTCIINDSRNRLSHHPPMGDTTTLDQFKENSNLESPRTARCPHNDGLNMGFVDGHSKWLSGSDAFGNAATYWPQ